MRIELVQSGGFAAITRRVVVNVDGLPRERREAVTRLIEAADVFALPACLGDPAPDRLQYDIAFHRAGARRAVCVHEPACPAPLRALIEVLLAGE